MRVLSEFAQMPHVFWLLPQKAWKLLLSIVAVLALLVINSPASATPPIQPTTVTGLGASTGWYSDDTRNASGADLVGINFTQHGKPGQTPSTADDSAISQQLQFVDGPAGSTGGGSVKIIAPTGNSAKSTLSTVNLGGFAPASDLISDDFSAAYRWYMEPNPTTRTVAFRIGIQSSQWANSQANYAAVRSGEQTWDLILVNLMDNPVANAWNDVSVDKDSGTWRLYAQAGNANWTTITGSTPPGGTGAPKTLAEWNADTTWGPILFGEGAKITNVQFGLGSSQQNCNVYVDYLETSILNSGNRINFAAPVLVVDGTTSEIKSGHTTIQAAISAASPGDIVQLAAGEFSTASGITINKAITIRGIQHGVDARTRGASETGESVLTSNGRIFNLNASNIVLDGLYIRNLNHRGMDTYTDADGFVVRNSVINVISTNTQGGAIQFGGGANLHANDFIFENNLVKGSTYGYLLYFGHSAANGLIKDNTLNSGGFMFGPFGQPDGWQIKGNLFDGEINGTPYQGYPLNAQFGQVAIEGNTLRKLYAGMQVSVINGTVTDNTFDDNQFYGIELWGGAWGSPVSTDVTISNNVFNYNGKDPGATSTSRGIRMGRPTDAPGINFSTINVNNNSFIDLGVEPNVYAIEQGGGTGTLDATCNWWGTDNGPAPGRISGSATTIPYLIDADLSSVCIGGLNVLNVTQDTLYATIQAAIDAAAEGDIIQVAAGTYAPTSQVLINKSISIIGAGSESTTIDVGGYNAWGVYISADNVTLQGFTIQGNAATNQQYGLKVGTGNNTGPSAHINEGLTLSDIKVQGTRRTGLDLNGVRNATLQGITATGATHGFGLSISSSHDVAITDLSTTGNAWGDVGIFPAQTIYQFSEIEDPSGIVFDGTIDLSSGNGSISVQDGALVSGGVWVGTISNDPTDNADVTVPTDFSRVVNSTRISDGLIMHNVGLESAVNSLALTLVSSGLFANTAIMNLNSGFWEVIPGLSIQSAINAAVDGDTIEVSPGLYQETLNLNRANLIVRSTDGAETTTIRGGGGAADADAVVRFGANGVTLQGFTIDRTDATANSRAIAPMASDGATISNNTIVNAFRGIQGDFYGKPTNLTISGNTFENTVQYGIAGTEDMANLTISGNTFRTTVEGIGLGTGVGVAVTPEELFAAQTWELPSGYAIKDYRAVGEPIIGAPYLAIPTNLAIAQGAANSALPAGVELGTTIPVNLETNSHSIGAVAFSLDLGANCISIADPNTAVQLAPGYPLDTLVFASLTGNELDIAVQSASALVDGLLLNVQVNYNSDTACLNPDGGVTAINFVVDDPAPSFGSLVGGSLTAGINQSGSLLTPWGDCNGDGSVDAGDISACILEIFDRDGSSRSVARYAGSFAGTIFCDSNQDLKIDAGDIVCTVRTINSLTCSASVAGRSLSAAMLENTILSGSTVQSSLMLNANNSAVAAVFALEINPAYHFDTTDSDGNGLPDALQLQIPADYQAAAVYDADSRLLQVIVASLSIPTMPLVDGPLATLTLTSAGLVENTQPVTIQDISLGDVDGGSLPVQVVDLPTQMNSRLYLPSVTR